MPQDNDLEDELLRRFQALTSTPTNTPGGPSSFRAASDEQARKAKEEDEELERIAEGRVPSQGGSLSKSAEDGELKRRMASLRGVDAEVEPEVDDDDAEVEAFIASLSSARPPETDIWPKDKPSASRTDSGRVLEKEARDILRLTNRHLSVKGPDSEDEDKREDEDEDEDEEDEPQDLETEDEIIRRAIDESRSGLGSTSDDERARPESPDGREVDLSERDTRIANGKGDPASDSQTSSLVGLSFPALPTHSVNENAETSSGQDKEMDARMAMLLGLSGPSTLPGPSVKLPSPPKEIKREPGQGWNLPGYKDDRDDDPDSWCCICNKDAEVICLGCENDPYCEGCWMEGHVRERHRTKRFAKPGGRKAIGA